MKQNKNDLRELTMAEAINEATDQAMAADPTVFIMGLGVPDPKGIFGTTFNLKEKYGSKRVLDMPVAENGMTGLAIGAAISGLRPVMTHQRIDFMLLAMDQIVNQAAKWHYMFDGKMKVPLVIRMIIGRGWGQGPQHSQSLQSWFTHIPGLKVVMPFSPYDAKGLLISAIRDNNPVIYLEHRWLHNLKGQVPEMPYTVPIGKGRIVRSGNDVTLVCVSHMTLEGIHTAKTLESQGISAEVIDVRSLAPLDETLMLTSVNKTGRVIVCDTGWKRCGVAGEIISIISEKGFSSLKQAPVRVTLPDYPLPTSPSLAAHYYPGHDQLVEIALHMFGKSMNDELKEKRTVPFDVPDISFTGPF